MITMRTDIDTYKRVLRLKGTDWVAVVLPRSNGYWALSTNDNFRFCESMASAISKARAWLRSKIKKCCTCGLKNNDDGDLVFDCDYCGESLCDDCMYAWSKNTEDMPKRVCPECASRMKT